MAESFDRSLDEIIKTSNISRQLTNGSRRNQSRPYNKNVPRRYPNSPHTYPAYNPVLTVSNKLSISNLDYGVTESDLQALFDEFGPIKSLTLHYDRSGRSLGTANVTYEMRQDALRALRIYNGVPLDGRPMQIEFSLPNRLQAQRIYLPPVKAYSAGTRVALSYSQHQRENFRRGSYGQPFQNSRPSNNASKFGNNRQNRAQKKQPTLEELDAELDAYVSNKN